MLPLIAVCAVGIIVVIGTATYGINDTLDNIASELRAIRKAIGQEDSEG